ncbi:MAG: hypothetical protein GZ091_13205 [Paludibacter sp.]|nr:hypothetical protein [Paludibacter sp.]
MKRKIKILISFFGVIIYNIFKTDYLLRIIKIKISKNVKIKKTILFGNIVIKNMTKITDSQLTGQITIKSEITLNKSILYGTVLLNNKSTINSSELVGVQIIGTHTEITDSKLTHSIVIGDNVVLEGCILTGSITIGNNSKLINNGLVLSGNIEIGRFSTLNGPNLDIYAAINKVKIGNFCSIARNVAFQEYNHKLNRVSTYHFSSNIFHENHISDIYSNGDIIIENDVWIGTQCVILSGAHISTGAIVAANSVVTGFIPPYAIVAGSPAKILKYRFEENVINELLTLEWWNWDVEKIMRNKSFLLSKNIDTNLVVN